MQRLVRGRHALGLSIGLLVLLPIFALASQASAQSGYLFPASVTVGNASATQTIAIHVASTGILGSTQVLTGGASNLDYSAVQGGTCTTGVPYAAGSTCTVSVSLTPHYPGIRDGAVVLSDVLGNVMGAQFLRGIGVGPLSVFAAGEITTAAGNGHLTAGNTTSTLAIDAVVREPLGEAVDGAGNLYFSDSGNNRIGKVDSSGNLTYIAGTGPSGFSPNGTVATSALLSEPAGILVDGGGNIYFTEIGNNTVREIVQATGLIQTIAGTGTQGYSGDGGAATSARLNMPQGIALDAGHNLFIADTFNNVIRKVSAADGTISTFAGDGNPGFAGDGQTVAHAEFDQPYGIAYASDGSLYIADFLNNRIRRISPVGILSTVAGTGEANYSGDEYEATGATMNHPSSVVVDAGGNLFISDSENNVVRKVNAASGHITTFAGNSAANSTGDGVNADSGQAAMNKTYGLALDPAGDLFIADRLGLRVREVYGNQGRILYKDIKVTNTSAPVSQTLDNDGNAPLHLTSITPVTNAAIDRASTTCTTTTNMAPGAECVIGVQFKPTVVGSPVTGSISIVSNAANSAGTIFLNGNSLTIEPSATVVKPTPNPSAFGQSVTIMATVSTAAGGNVIPKGTVQFFDGETLIGTATLANGSGSSATCSVSTSSLTVGQHTITAVYSGQAGVIQTSTSPQVLQIVLQSPSLKLSSNENPALLENPIIFTAQFVGASNRTPSGNVTFKDSDGTTLDTQPVNPNSANATSNAISTLSAGTHTITATYSGDTNYAPTSAPYSQIIQKISTAVGIAASNNPSIAGGIANFTVNVTALHSTSPTLPISGTISLTDNGAPLPGSRQVAALGTSTATATVTVPVTGLSTGTHNIVAIYSGDSNYLGSSSPISPQNVIRATSTVALAASPALTVASKPVTFTATVTSSGGTPDGTVNFSIDGGTPLSGTLTNGIASITLSTLSVGSHIATASYLGDTNDSPGTSAPVSVTIVAATTTIALTSSQNPLLTLSPVTITATVANGGGPTLTGSVTFSQDGAAISTIAVTAKGSATLSLPSLPAGSHTFTATYSGDVVDLPSSSKTLTETVQLRATTDELTTSATSLTGGQQITLISIVRWTGPTTPTGTVTFFDGTQTLSTAPVDGNGVATVTVLLTGTSATISSVYGGDAFYASSTSVSDSVAIGPAPNFNFVATPPTFSLVTAQYQIMTVNIASVKNFTDTLALGCLGLPQDATCNFSKDQIVLSAGGSESIQLIVDTGHPLLGGSQAKSEAGKKLGTAASNLIVACFLPGSLLLGLVGLRFRRLHNFGGLMVLALLLAGMSTALTGCGSVHLASTPPGVYNFTVTATGKTGISQSLPVTMTVTQ